jgi:hypothetical protein
MLTYQHGPNAVEAAYDVRGPCVRGGLATTDPKYVTALFMEPIAETSTSTSAILVDMAKWADGTTRAEWIRGGVFVRIKADQKCHVAQRLDSSTSTTATRVTTSVGHPLDAGEEIELRFDEDLRWLEYIWDSTTGTLTHFVRQLPNKALSLSDT